MSVLAAFTLNGLGVFWAIALAAVLALIGLSLLWNARASEFFRTN
jgi:fucose permease